MRFKTTATTALFFNGFSPESTNFTNSWLIFATYVNLLKIWKILQKPESANRNFVMMLSYFNSLKLGKFLEISENTVFCLFGLETLSYSDIQTKMTYDYIIRPVFSVQNVTHAFHCSHSTKMVYSGNHIYYTRVHMITELYSKLLDFKGTVLMIGVHLCRMYCIFESATRLNNKNFVYN
jgi:hypothetical protein